MRYELTEKEGEETMGNMKFTQDHEWITVDGSVATVGISDYAQRALGDIVFVEMPSVGAAVVAGKEFGSVESVKAVSDLFSPVSGSVIEVNASLEEAPELLNEDAYKNWIIKVELSDAGELDRLMDEAVYAKFCETEDAKG
jgi:glycine cleavage system H protein